jgi:FlaA1/EpsC-like NDP-sugar epimerase
MLQGGRDKGDSGWWDVGQTARALLSEVANAILSLPRPLKRLIMIGSDALMLPVALWSSIGLKFGFGVMPTHVDLLSVAAGAGIVIFGFLGLYRAVIRFVGPQVMGIVLTGTLLLVAVLTAWDHIAHLSYLSASVLTIFTAFALLYLIASRFAVRYLFYYGLQQRGARRVAIYGAGEAGAKLCAALLGGPDFRPVAFIDDNPALRGSRINGIKVYELSNFESVVADLKIERVLLAIPNATRRHRREILERLAHLGVHVQSMPLMTDLVCGKARIDELQEIDAGDLLGRDPVLPNKALFESSIREKSVMVTGAGGSIGSELCRQILQCAPRRLVLFEISEFALYEIERELSRMLATRDDLRPTELIPLLGNAQQRTRLREIMATFGVQTVYHTAAYKHVPIVEHNVVEGIQNNVLGTLHAAEAAMETGVDTFVLISSDKAVNPTNVMGATKRFAELVLQALQARSKHTRFCIVRFGNVLASSGSVVPLFQEQIRRGGPVTVTHPEVMRYFMTIAEAAQLVIQAAALAAGGDVFVLDMGQPVKIDDLARRMINLMGLTVRDKNNPEGDIEIKYTGLRAAEKLFEELVIGKNVMGTDHPKIMRAIEHGLAWDRAKQILDELLAALATFDCRRSVALLSEAVEEYPQIPTIRDHVWLGKMPIASAEDDRKVTDLASKRRIPDAASRNPEGNPRAG